LLILKSIIDYAEEIKAFKYANLFNSYIVYVMVN